MQDAVSDVNKFEQFETKVKVNNDVGPACDRRNESERPGIYIVKRHGEMDSRDRH